MQFNLKESEESITSGLLLESTNSGNMLLDSIFDKEPTPTDEVCLPQSLETHVKTAFSAISKDGSCSVTDDVLV